VAKIPIGKAPFTDIDLNDLPDFLIAEAPVNSIVDSTTTAGVTYFCEAPVGIASSVAGWRICKYTAADGTFKWADGNAAYDNIADNRASLTYLFAPA